MGPPHHIGVRARRLVHLFVVLTTAALLAAPLLFGPATPYFVRALGGQNEHHCACGMQAGKCGCPECAALEGERQAEHESPLPLLRSSCDDGEQVPVPTALPPAAPPAAFTLAAPIADEVRNVLVPMLDPSRDRAAPEPPPPRRGA